MRGIYWVAMFKEFITVVPYLKKYKLNYIVGILFLIVVDGAQIFIPQQVKRAVNAIADGGFSMSAILKPALAMVLISLGVSVGRFFWRYFIIGASRRIETEMRDRLFAHLMDLSSDFYQENTTGDLMARATNDMNAVRQSMGMGFVSFVDGIFMSSMILIAMISGNPRVALFTILPLPIITILILFFGKLVGVQFKRVQEVFSTLSEIAQESIAGMRVVKAFVKEGYFAGKFSATNDDYRNSVIDLVKTFGLFFPLISFLAGLSTAILLFVGGDSVVRNRMSPGDIIAMISYLEMLIWPLMGAGFTVNLLQRGTASLKRINAILDTKSSIEEDAKAVPLSGGIDLGVQNLEYAYKGAEKPALFGISFELKEGQTLGILGKVGSGKSTLLKILPRLIDPGPGMVRLGGRDIRELRLMDLRGCFGFVPQVSFLFSDSIKSNLLFGAPDVSPERFTELIRVVALDKDLKLFPAGLETVVGEKGLTLSGGQKQRVALARALAIDPRILVLDDALSAVDAETEEKILANLLKERKGRTNIIVSHRVSTLRHADRILVLDGGRLSQYGTHETLLAEREGFYARIAGLQELEAGAGKEH
jgi:ATP-binding cassette subfamily B protein